MRAVSGVPKTYLVSQAFHDQEFSYWKRIPFWRYLGTLLQFQIVSSSIQGAAQNGKSARGAQSAGRLGQVDDFGIQNSRIKN